MSFFETKENVHSFEKSPKSEYVPECRRFSGNDARLEWKRADDRVVAAGQVVEVVVVIDAGLQFGLLLGQAGSQGLVKETTSSESKSKSKVSCTSKNWRRFSNFFREKHLMIGIKDLDIVKTWCFARKESSQLRKKIPLKGRDQWEWICLWKVAIDRHLVRFVVIDVHFYFSLAAILE